MADEADKKPDAPKAPEAPKTEKKAAAAKATAYVAVHRIMVGAGKDAQTIPAGALVPGANLTAKARDELLKLGALREANDAERAVAEMQARAAGDENPLG